MSLDSILGHILDEANAQADKIIREAEEKATGIIQEAKAEAQKLYQEILEKEKALYEKERQCLIVNARLEQRKNLLAAKQELIGAAFERLKQTAKLDKFKRQVVTVEAVKEVPEDVDFYLVQLRQDYETEISAILFK